MRIEKTCIVRDKEMREGEGERERERERERGRDGEHSMGGNLKYVCTSPQQQKHLFALTAVHILAFFAATYAQLPVSSVANSFAR